MQLLKPYNRMQMQLASISVLSQPPLAAMPQLSEKPHLGFATKKTAWNPGPNVCNFTVTLGLQVAVVENSVRKTYSARYYNPATGRFLSRDPEDGGAIDPGSLHKYLYANGDPVNGWDPDGRADEEESGLKFALIEDAALPALREFVGDFIRLQAIPWIVRGARSTAAAARVVAIFLEDVARTKLAKGLLKLYVCYELGVLFVDLTLDLDVAHISEDARKSYERLADAGMIYVCSEHML